MLPSADLEQAIPIALARRAAASNKASATIDTLCANGAKARWIAVRCYHGTGFASAIRFRVNTVSATTTLFASGTALDTTCSAVLTSGQSTLFLISTDRTKRYLRVKMSGVSNTAATMVLADKIQNEQVPPSALQGFTSVTRLAAS